jgi:UDP-2,4-diacetamido-2,4,6-trideoxy-beta-L-altropyranose hydrolase
MRVVFRVDASSRIGLGHLVRCLALARAVRSLGADVLFLVRRHDVDVSARIAESDCALRWLAPPGSSDVNAVAVKEPVHASWGGVPWSIDAAESAWEVSAWNAGWVVIDHYSFDARWHRYVRRETGARVAAIDDLSDRDLDVDLLIDHNFVKDHQAKYAGRVAPGTRILGGPRFALIGPAYAKGPRYVFGGAVRKIGIFMGGIDASQLTARAWEGCRGAAGFTGTIGIATTSANPHLSRLRAQIAGDHDASLAVDLPDLSGFFAEHDLQIGAGGGATWERCCVGAPALVLIVAENQRSVVEELSAAGVVAALLRGHGPTAEAIGRAVADLVGKPDRLATMSARSRQLVDGLGAGRVALSMLASSLQVRRAVLADAELMHAWRNDSATRAVSRAADPIHYDQHLQWLQKVLGDADRLLLIGQIGSRPIGVVRFDRHGVDLEVSIYLDPSLQGLGIGGRLLHEAEAFATAQFGPEGKFLATVLGHNPASRRMFEAGGYDFSSGRWVKPLGDRQSGQTK